MTNTAHLTPSQAGVLAVRGCAPGLAPGLAEGRYATRWTESGTALLGPAALFAGTGLPVAVRLRVPAVGSRALDVPMTGLPVGAARTPSTNRTSTTPGDLPPRDPLS